MPHAVAMAWAPGAKGDKQARAQSIWPGRARARRAGALARSRAIRSDPRRRQEEQDCTGRRATASEPVLVEQAHPEGPAWTPHDAWLRGGPEGASERASRLGA